MTTRLWYLHVPARLSRSINTFIFQISVREDREQYIKNVGIRNFLY